MTTRQWKVAVLGATGLVGDTMIKILEERNFPVAELFPLASSRSLGKTVEFHGKHVPVIDVDATDTGAMDRVVTESLSLALEGDVVLLAPAAASMDMFADYGARGDAFVDAVNRLAAGE